MNYYFGVKGTLTIQKTKGVIIMSYEDLILETCENKENFLEIRPQDRQIIDNILSEILSKREKFGISLYFGLSGPRHKIDEIATKLKNMSLGKSHGKMGISKERARQVLNKAIRKIKRSDVKLKLGFLFRDQLENAWQKYMLECESHKIKSEFKYQKCTIHDMNIPAEIKANLVRSGIYYLHEILMLQIDILYKLGIKPIEVRILQILINSHLVYQKNL